KQRAAAGKVVVRRHGREDDVVDLRRRDPCLLERNLRRAQAEIRGGGAVRDVVALLDARALADPLIGGVKHLRQLMILDLVLTDDEAGTLHDGAHWASSGMEAHLLPLRPALVHAAPRRWRLTHLKHECEKSSL